MKIYLLTLGCAKNRVDSECLAGALKAAGHELVPEVEQAQAAIVNTCGFIRPAVEESIEAILDLEELRQKGELEKIGVVGCLVNRYREGLTSEIPSVDFWAETEDWESVLKSLATPLDGARRRERVLHLPEYLILDGYLRAQPRRYLEDVAHRARALEEKEIRLSARLAQYVARVLVREDEELRSVAGRKQHGFHAAPLHLAHEILGRRRREGEALARFERRFALVEPSRHKSH